MMNRMGTWPEMFLNLLLGVLAAGIYAGGLFSLPIWPLLLFSAAAFFVVAFLLWRRSARTWLALAVLFLLVGALRGGVAHVLPVTDIARHAGEVGTMTGVLRAAPIVTEDAHGVRHVRCEVEASSFRDGRGKNQPVSGGLYLHARLPEGADAPLARPGDRVQAVGKVQLPRRYNNPGQIDAVRRLLSQGITALFSARPPGVKIEPVPGASLRRWAEAVRQHYRESMATAMPKGDAAALFALLFGGYEGIRPELTEAFVATGVVHILSVSGSHISLLAAVMAWLGTWLRLPRALVSALVIFAIAFYSLLAGLVPPVLRSALMGGLTFLAVALEREKEAQRILTITGLSLLLVSPLLLFDISFQLSFAATAGLLYLAPRFRDILRGWPEFLRGGLSITLAAQLLTLPFLAWYFHQVSLSSLLANLTIVPLLEFMMMAALFAGIVAFFLPLAGHFLFSVDSLLLGIVYEMARFMARLPGSVLYVPTMGFGVSALYYAGLFLWCGAAERRQAVWAWLAAHGRGVGAGAALFVVAFFGWHMSRPAEMAVHFIDVHQGNAALVTTPHGRAFMIDTGGVRDHAFDVGGRVDLPYLYHYGVRALDFILLTHAHEDHAGGTGSLLTRIPVGFVWTGHEPRAEYAKSLGAEVQAPALEKLAPAREGAVIDVDGVRVEVLHAPQDVSHSSGNEASNVYRVSYGATSFLFTGDLVEAQEAEVLKKQPHLQSTVLQVGHHGSDTSSSPAFVAAVRPAWAVISVGADNPFGHPRPQVVDRLIEAGAEICRTDEDGAIVFRSDGTRLRVERYRERGWWE
ncbi:MAG: DNA internalization-related competence protein ComEC/Rec2 [Schwartzia sp. (in: firmicutes)]